jgi:hypothetical protein
LWKQVHILAANKQPKIKLKDLNTGDIIKNDTGTQYLVLKNVETLELEKLLPMKFIASVSQFVNSEFQIRDTVKLKLVRKKRNLFISINSFIPEIRRTVPKIKHVLNKIDSLEIQETVSQALIYDTILKIKINNQWIDTPKFDKKQANIFFKYFNTYIVKGLNDKYYLYAHDTGVGWTKMPNGVRITGPRSTLYAIDIVNNMEANLKLIGKQKSFGSINGYEKLLKGEPQ